MNKFFTDLFSSFFIDLKNRKWVYVCAICTIVIGIIIGIILCFTVDDLNVMLSLSEKNFVSYMKGEAELGTIFLEKFRWIIVAYLFIIVFSFTSVTFILGLMYICYQSAIIILTMAALISSFGFTGFLNALLIVLPFNLILVIIISLLLVNLYIFFYNNKKSGEKMFSCKLDYFAYFRALCLIIVGFIVCVILSYFIPYLLKSLIIVSF